jgi:two-component system OmpR family response regulator
MAQAGALSPLCCRWVPSEAVLAQVYTAMTGVNFDVVRVLIAEDDDTLGEVLARGLSNRGYVVDLVSDGETALSYTRCYNYAVAVLDWLMPGVSGIDVVRQLRRHGTRTPVLMISGRDTPEDRVAGLDAGADDYMVKPFDLAELLARLRALQRRPPDTLPPRLVVGDLECDPASREVRVGDRRMALTATELGILETLIRFSPAVADRRQIAQHVWIDEAETFSSNTIDVHLARLRAKLSGSRARIETVRGIGYRIVAARA